MKLDAVKDSRRYAWPSDEGLSLMKREDSLGPPGTSVFAGFAPERRIQTILLIEDNPEISELEQRLLEKAGYRVIMAPPGTDPVDVYLRMKDEISLVIAEFPTPDFLQRDYLTELLKADPFVKVIMVSNYFPNGTSPNEVNSMVHGFLQKPFSIADLLNKTRAALA